MNIVFLKQAEKELRSAPREIIERLFPILEELGSGKFLSLPISRPLPGVAKKTCTKFVYQAGLENFEY